MVGVFGKGPVGSRISMGSEHGVEFTGEMQNLDDMLFGFLEGEGSFDSVSSGASTNDFEDEEDQQNENSDDHVEKSKAYWESQHQLLQTTLFRTSSIETKIRQATKDALRESSSEEVTCGCRRPVDGGCRNCLLKDISGRLEKAGFDSAVCKSKWRSSEHIPSGEHTYIDVVHKSSAEHVEVRVVIELKFRAEFEMARASEEYHAMMERLPEFYVGKADRLQALIKILCSAAKRCMKDNSMHMGPWRKHKYMQAKWFASYERIMSEPRQTKSLCSLQRLVKPKASLLTFDLLDKMNSSFQHFAAVEVV